MDSDEEKVVEKVSNFLEMDRLAYVVRAIEFECQVVPVESHRMTTSHELERNVSFKGLGKQQAQEAKSYLHFRQPTSRAKQDSASRFIITSFKRGHFQVRLPRFHCRRLASRRLVHPTGS